MYVTVTGATIEKGTATGEGGNICVGASGTGDSQLTITDTTITEGTAKTGGNIRVAAGAVVTVDGEKSLIEKGATNNSGHGGNVNVAGTFTQGANTLLAVNGAHEQAHYTTDSAARAAVEASLTAAPWENSYLVKES